MLTVESAIDHAGVPEEASFKIDTRKTSLSAMLGKESRSAMEGLAQEKE